MQKIYWKKKFTDRRVKYGDANTFFHAMATEIYRQNIISQIQDSDGRMVSDHMEKVDLFGRNFAIDLVSQKIHICFLTCRFWLSLLQERKLIPLSKSSQMTNPQDWMDLMVSFSSTNHKRRCLQAL